MRPGRPRAAGSLAAVLPPSPQRPSALIPRRGRGAPWLLPLLTVVALVAGCGYFEADEQHLSPRAPLLPPTTEALAVQPALTAPQPPAGAPDPAAAEVSGSGDGGADADADPPGDEASPDGGDTETSSSTDTDGESSGTGGEDTGVEDTGTGEAQLLRIVVVDELSHDTTAFTQGLEISGGRLYESTGAPGDRSSSIRELDRSSGEVLRLETIGEGLFAEGLTFVDGRIYQLTWQDGVALVWDPEDLTEQERFDYEGQGWGLCHNGSVLVQSDGSAELHFRNPTTFERAGNPVLVTLNGEELPSLNELECVGDRVWANVWQTDLIVRIHPVTGRVEALADASGIGLPRSDDPNAVLNGIAWDPRTETFLITGKDWPAIYEVTFEPTGPPDEDR